MEFFELDTVFNPEPIKCSIKFKDKFKELILFEKGSGFKLKDIFKNIEIISKLIRTKNVILKDYLKYLEYFNLNVFENYNVYDCQNYDLNSIPLKWMKLISSTQNVYKYIENRGLYNGYNKLDFKFGINRTGRSKVSNFNLHGIEKGVCLRTDNKEFDYYIHIDWISADLRYAAHESQDPDMDNIFKVSDPYSELSDNFGIDKQDIKNRFLSGIYSLNFNDPIFDAYPKFKQWLIDKKKELEINNFLSTCMGRKFFVNDKNSDKFVFSGMISGSIAHAMQNVMCRIFQICPQNLLFDIHDSVVLISKKNDIKNVINYVKDVMLYPYDGIYDNIRFPYRIYIGNRWREWSLFKEVR